MQPDVFDNSRGGGGYAAVATGILFLPVLVMLVFRRKYPGWWFDWNLELTRFTTRISAYLLLLDDRYPSTDDHQSVHLDLERPDGAALSRWLPLVKWLLAIPALHRAVRAGDRLRSSSSSVRGSPSSSPAAIRAGRSTTTSG